MTTDASSDEGSEVTCQDCWITACGYSAVLVNNRHVDLQPPRL